MSPSWWRRHEDLDAELATHIEMSVRDRVARCESEADARSAALREFGNLTHIAEVTRDVWKWTWLERLSRLHEGLRYTLRRLANAPAFTVTVIGSLALGIAATTTMFSVVDAVDFQPLPFPNAHRLVTLREVAPSGSSECSRMHGCVTVRSSRPMISDWREQSRTLDAVAGYRLDLEYRWNHGDETEPLRATDVSENLFAVLGVRPLLGRTFLPSEIAMGGEPAIVLGYDLWRTRFGGDSAVIGRRISITSLNFLTTVSPVIVGVMPQGFRILTETAWLPMRSTPASHDRREKGTVFAIGLLRHGARIEEAQAEAQMIAARIASAYPDADSGWSADIQPLSAVALLRIPTIDNLNPGGGRCMLFGIVSLVLLVATVNVALLFLVRGRSRRHELTVRKAIGASRARLVSLLLTESLTVSVAGGALGALLALWGVRIATQALGLSSYGIPIGVDLRALIFTMVVAVGAGVLASLPPVLQLTGFDAGNALREHSGSGGRGSVRRSWTQRALVSAEIASVLVLLTGAGVLGKEMRRLRRDEPGYDSSGLYSLTAALPKEVMRDNPRHHVIAARARAGIGDVGGVRGTAILAPTFVTMHIDGQVDSVLSSTSLLAIGPDFFSTVGTAVIQGRAIDSADVVGAPSVAMVDETAAARFWPGESAIGKTVVLRSWNDTTTSPRLAQVVGVAARSKLWVTPLTSAPEPLVYVPFDQDRTSARAELIVLARTTSVSPQTLSAMRWALHQATHGPVDITDVVSQEERISTELRQYRFDTMALSAFALFGLVLAVVGIYGVVAFTVAQRTREIGVRMALGAQRADVLALVSRETLTVVLCGIAMGLVTSVAFTRILRVMLVGTSATDPGNLSRQCCLDEHRRAAGHARAGHEGDEGQSGYRSSRQLMRIESAFLRSGVLGALLASAVATTPAAAQLVTGHLRDSTGVPLPGVVISALASDRTLLRATFTRDDGSFSLLIGRPGSSVIIAKRIGYRPTDPFQLQLRDGETRDITIVMRSVPYAQPRVTVRGRSDCVTTPGDSGDVGTVWNDVRAALIAWKLSQGENEADMRVRRFHRFLDVALATESKRTETTIAGRIGLPFVSAPAESLALTGYVTLLGGNVTRYYAPDADVILSDVFVRTHCWSLVAAQSGDSIGLHFSPVRRRTVSDIEGTLWVNRDDRRLRSLSFGYRTLPEPMEDLSASGMVAFGQHADGRWYPSRWLIRMPVYDDRSGSVWRGSAPTGYVQKPVIAFYEEAGGDAIPLADVAMDPSTGGAITESLGRSADARSIAPLHVIDRAQQLTGTLRDSLTQLPLAQANVTLEDSLGTELSRETTSADGSFTLRDLPGGSFRIVARRLGYVPFRSELRSEGGFSETRFIIELSRTPSTLSPAVVTAAAEAGNTVRVFGLNKMAINGFVVSAEQLDHVRAGSRTVADIVRRFSWPGITVVTGENGEECVLVAGRGATRNQRQCALVVADGIPIGELMSIDPESIESLVFMRPVEAATFWGSISTGSGEAMESVRGGVLLLTMKRGKS